MFLKKLFLLAIHMLLRICNVLGMLWLEVVVVNQKEFGLYICNLRIKRGYESQRQLALTAGISSSTLLRIENGTSMATPKTLKKLAPHLHISYTELMEKAGYLSSATGESTPSHDICDPSRYNSKQILPTKITAEENEFLKRFRKLKKKDRQTLKIIADQFDDKDSQAATMD